MVKIRHMSKSGTEIIKDIKTKSAGYLEVVEENGIVEKVIHKSQEKI